MKLAVIGAGYVGLVTGTCLAEMGNDVVCVDVDEDKLETLRKGRMPFFEPGLLVLLERNLREDRISFVSDLQSAIPGADVVFLALPTPSDDDGSANLTYVKAAATSLAPHLSGYTVIASKSTVPVGSTEIVGGIIEEFKPSDATFDVVSNPEFLREGVAVDDFMKPERVVVGSSSDRATAVMTELYDPFVRSGNPILVMDARSAELTKYAANCFLASKITFMNEVANLCDLLGADVDQIRRGIGADSRIGRHFLYAGIGYGGSCFPKDVRALAHTADAAGYDFKILDAVMAVNRLQRRDFAERVVDYFGGNLDGKRIAVWGLSFKPNTDDVREAPALDIVERFLETGASVTAFDPEAMGTARAILGDRVRYAPSAIEAVEDANALVICTEWNEFRRPDFDEMAGAMAEKVIFDGRNIYKPSQLRSLGFHYESIGRPASEVQQGAGETLRGNA